MPNIWTTALSRRYAYVMDQIEAALRNCPDELWEESLWEVKKTDPYVWPVSRIDDRAGGDEATMEQLLQVHSAFWNVAYHTVFHIDFYLSRGVLKGFKPPAPFREVEHRGNVVPNRAYSRAELQGYLVYVRQKARTTIEALTDEQASAILKRTGLPFAEFLLRTILHSQEHAAQLNLLLAQHGIEPKGGAAAAMGRQYLREGVRNRGDKEIDVFVKSIGGYPQLLPRVFAGFCSRIDPREPCVVRFDVGPASSSAWCPARRQSKSGRRQTSMAPSR
jgi:hypothetical protein